MNVFGCAAALAVAEMHLHRGRLMCHEAKPTKPPEQLARELRKETNLNRLGIEARFTYHPPRPNQPERYKALRDKAKELAILMCEECPDSRELATAMTHLDAVVMFANAAIARNEP